MALVGCSVQPGCDGSYRERHSQRERWWCYGTRASFPAVQFESCRAGVCLVPVRRFCLLFPYAVPRTDDGDVLQSADSDQVSVISPADPSFPSISSGSGGPGNQQFAHGPSRVSIGTGLCFFAMRNPGRRIRVTLISSSSNNVAWSIGKRAKCV